MQRAIIPVAAVAPFAVGALLPVDAVMDGPALCPFRAVTGQTIHAYRMQLRVRSALERIERASDLSAVALALGFSSHSHFTASFRRAFGVTPSGVRGDAR